MTIIRAVLTMLSFPLCLVSMAHAQYLHLYRNEKGEVVAADYQGDAGWLAGQTDEKSKLHKFPHLEGLRLIHHGISHAEMQYVAGLTNLKELTIGIAPEALDIDETSFALVSKMTGLESLHVCKHRLTDRDLTALTKLNRLSSLVIEIKDDFKHRGRIGLTDGAAESLVPIKTLEELRFRGYSDFSDEFVERLSTLPNLRALEVSSERLTDKALATVGNMAHLRDLEFSSPNLTDEGVKSTTKASSLERLVLISPKVSAKSIEYLEPLKCMRELELPIQRLESSTVAALGRMRCLEMLALRKAPIRDDDIIGLKNHPSLKRIFFGSAQLTDRSLDALKSMKNLEYVDLGRPSQSAKLQSMIDAHLREKKVKSTP